MTTVLELTTPVEFVGTTPGTVDLKNSTTFTIDGVEGDKNQITYTSPGTATVLFYVRDSFGDSWNGHDIDVEDASGDSSIEILNENGESKDVITVLRPTAALHKSWNKFEVTLKADYKIKFGSGSFASETRLFIVNKSEEVEATFDASHLGTENNTMPSANVLFVTSDWTHNSSTLADQTKTPAELMPTLNFDPVTITDGVFNVTQEMLVANDIMSFTATYGELSKTGSIETPDTIAPVITLNGSSSVTIGTSVQGASYTDAGATAHDARDGDISSSITTTGSVDISEAGTYTITYNVSDTAGNAAESVTRTVNVLQHDSSVVFKPADRAELKKGLDAYFTDDNYGTKKDNAVDISGENLKNSDGDTIPTVLFMGDIGDWNVSEVTSFYRLFYYARNFNQDITKWNVSNVEIMSDMFWHANNFNQDLRTTIVTPGSGDAYLAWDVKSVTNMQNMFRSTTNYAENGISDKQLNWNLSNSLPDSLLTNMFSYSSSANTTLYGSTPSRDKFLGNTLGQSPYAAFTSITDFTESENYTIHVVEGASAQETLFLNVPGATNFKLEILENDVVKVATDGTATANTAKGGTLELSSIDSLTNQTAFYDDNGTTKYGEIPYTGLKATLTYTAASDIVGISKLSENLQVKASYTDPTGDKTVTLTVAITNLETKPYVAGQTTYTIDLVNEYGAAAGTPDLVTNVTNFADKEVTVNLIHDGLNIPHIFTYTLGSDPQTLHDDGFSATELYHSGKFVEAEPLLGIYTKTELEGAGYTIWYEKNVPDNTTLSIYHHLSYDRISNPLYNIVPLIEDYVPDGTSLTNSKTIRNELKNNWRFILERTTDNEIFDITFKDTNSSYHNNLTWSHYLYFSTTPDLQNNNYVTNSYKVTKMYNQTPIVEITLDGDATMTLNVGDSFVDPGAITDIDGVTATVTGSVVTSVVGTYTLTYTADGATEDKVRTVTVLPTVQDVNATADKNQPTSFFLKYNTPAGESSPQPEPEPSSSTTVFSTTTGTSDLFATGPNATWTNVLMLARTVDGASSQEAQTMTMNVTALPTDGANYRVYKTTANGSDYFSGATALSLGLNTVTVNGVSFNRTVKIQFSSADIAFNALVVNNETSYPVPSEPEP